MLLQLEFQANYPAYLSKVNHHDLFILYIPILFPNRELFRDMEAHKLGRLLRNHYVKQIYRVGIWTVPEKQVIGI